MSKVEQIISGQSRANVLTQYDIAELFKKGVDGKRSPSDNYSSENGMLLHYRTIEAIRTKDGIVIGNTQCWSSGFAKCSIGWTDSSLPLSTIWSFGSGDESLRNIRILDTDRLSVLFTMPVNETLRYFLYGEDDGRFLVQLPKACSSINEAIESLKPSHTYDSTPRQGDLFFIPLEPSSEEPEGIHEKAHYVLKAHYEYDVVLPGGIHDMGKLTKEKKIPSIMGTRHSAQEMITSDGVTYVKGYILHPQHKTLKLNGWHMARRNEAVIGYDVPARGWSGGVD